MTQTNLIKNDKTKHSIEVFNDFHCKDCGSADLFVYESEKNVCIKCEDCNERYMISKKHIILRGRD